MTPPLTLRHLVRAAAVVLTLAVIVVVIQSIRRDGPAALAAWRAAHVRWAWVALSVACGATGHAFYVVAWRRLLNDAGIRVPLWQLARMFLVSNLGRYLPAGKAWQMGIIGVMSAEHGFPATMIAASSLFQGVVGFGVGTIVLLAAGGTVVGVSMAWLAVPLAGVAALLVAPVIIRSSPRLQEVLAKRMHIANSVTPWTMWMLVWTSVASWVMWGIALFALAGGVLSSPGASVAAYITAWSASFLAGLIAIVSPAGLGAREGAMQAVLANAGVAAGDLLVLVVIARVWVTILDVVPAVTVLAFRRRRRV